MHDSQYFIEKGDNSIKLYLVLVYGKPVPTDVKPSRHKTKNLIKIKSKSKDLKEESK
jgi:hypothetical protein